MAKVLLVEDDNNLREIYEARLQAEGYDTATASDGEQALVVAKETKPDLVISDVMMPKISGFEMLDILRNTDGMKDVKVIMLTALGQAEDKTRADQLGADKYLVKSQVTLEDIVKTAHQLLDDAPAAAPAAPAPAEPTAAPAVSDPTASAIPAPAADAPSTEQEAQAMQAQIDDFAAQPAVDPPVAEPAAELVPTPAPATPAPTPDPAPAAADDTTAAAHDDVMADAVDSLNGTAGQKPSDVTAVEVAPPAVPAAPDPAQTDDSASADDGVSPGHKKIIQPISDSADAKLDINQLLAAEEAKESTTVAPVAPVPAPEPVTAAPPEPVAPAAAAPAVTPEPSIELPVASTPAEPAPAAETPTAAPPAPATAVTPPTVTEPPVDPNAPNPNDIAL